MDVALDAAKPAVGRLVRKAMEEIADEAQAQSELAAGWGLEPGTVSRTDPKERLELARRMRNPRLLAIAEIMGRLVNTAWTARKSPTNAIPEEIYSVTLGADLPHVLPMEFAGLVMPALRVDFLRKLADRHLLQYSLRGNEALGKGPIIGVFDHSGSMVQTGADLWVTALGLTLMKVAKEQGRTFHAVCFGGPGVVRTFSFTKPDEFTPTKMMDYAEFFINDGGTHFETGLDAAVAIMEAEHAETGKVSADIVFGTDGEAQVPATWLEAFKATQARLGFTAYGFAIGGGPDVESIASICDGRVFTVRSLRDGSDVKDILAGLW